MNNTTPIPGNPVTAACVTTRDNGLILLGPAGIYSGGIPLDPRQAMATADALYAHALAALGTDRRPETVAELAQLIRPDQARTAVANIIANYGSQSEWGGQLDEANPEALREVDLPETVPDWGIDPNDESAEDINNYYGNLR